MEFHIDLFISYVKNPVYLDDNGINNFIRNWPVMINGKRI